MRKPTAVSTPNAPKAIGPYSQAVQAGDLLFVSGQLPADPETGAFVPGSVRDQTERVLKNIGAILEAAGMGFENVVRTTVFLTDMRTFSEMNEVYSRWFGQGGAIYPARATLEVSALPKGAMVEIDAVAAKLA